jgi:Uma2 family endonuclease
VASLPNSKAVTYEEWLRMPEVSDAREEVVNGEIRIMPPGKRSHAEIVDNIAEAFRRSLNRRDVWIVTMNLGLVIRKAPLTSRVPDLMILQRSTMVEEDGYIHSAPQFVVEVLSPANTRRHQEEKIADYSEIGVPEFWVASPEARTIEVLYLEDGWLRPHDVLIRGILRPRLFPAVEVDVATIWPD